MKKLFTDFLLVSISPASLKEIYRIATPLSQEKKTLHVQKQLYLIIMPLSFTCNEVNNSLLSFQSILISVLINVTRLLCMEILKCDQQVSYGTQLCFMSSLVYVCMVNRNNLELRR